MASDPLAQRVASYIDRNHPKFGSLLLKLRWGGLRTIEPTPALGAATLSAGTGAALGVRRALLAGTGGRLRLPLVLAAPGGAAAAWLALWRWDSLRWRRRHVALVLDLTPPAAQDLVAHLAAKGLTVEPWTGPRAAGGAAQGISCRARDLRRVNAAIDELSRETSAATS